jgi:hypothetical protein
LAELKKRASAVGEDVREREEKEPLVARWRAWVVAGGVARVETLKTAALRAAEAARLQTTKLTAFDAKAETATKDYDKEVNAKRKRLEDVVDEVEVLDGLEVEFGDYQATGESVIDPKTTARELRGKTQADRTALTKAAEAVTKRASTIRQALTARDNAVRELVEASLQRVSEGSDISRAAELCTCYRACPEFCVRGIA